MAGEAQFVLLGRSIDACILTAAGLRNFPDLIFNDPADPVSQQVEQSFNNSLKHLRTDWIDSYVLHGPTSSDGLHADDWSAWRAIDVGMIPLTGTTNAEHMRADLDLFDFQLTPGEVEWIEGFAAR